MNAYRERVYVRLDVALKGLDRTQSADEVRAKVERVLVAAFRGPRFLDVDVELIESAGSGPDGEGDPE